MQLCQRAQTPFLTHKQRVLGRLLGQLVPLAKPVSQPNLQVGLPWFLKDDVITSKAAAGTGTESVWSTDHGNTQLVNVWSLVTAGVPPGFICAFPTRTLVHSVFRDECVSFPFQSICSSKRHLDTFVKHSHLKSSAPLIPFSVALNQNHIAVLTS